MYTWWLRIAWQNKSGCAAVYTSCSPCMPPSSHSPPLHQCILPVLPKGLRLAHQHIVLLHLVIKLPLHLSLLGVDARALLLCLIHLSLQRLHTVVHLLQLGTQGAESALGALRIKRVFHWSTDYPLDGTTPPSLLSWFHFFHCPSWDFPMWHSGQFPREKRPAKTASLPTNAYNEGGMKPTTWSNFWKEKEMSVRLLESPKGKEMPVTLVEFLKGKEMPICCWTFWTFARAIFFFFFCCWEI